ncbi:MAG: hypothetical protein GC137_00945 [Alphaproteobacteria bacterium]|nr:hypothetical protein [Alphaproteobacteria bacterium]
MELGIGKFLSGVLTKLANVAYKPKFGDVAISAIKRDNPEFDLDALLPDSKMSLREGYAYCHQAMNGHSTDEVPDIHDRLTDFKFALFDLSCYEEGLSEYTQQLVFNDYVVLGKYQQKLFQRTGMRGRIVMESEAAEAQNTPEAN